LGESKFKVGQLIACYYKTIPPTPQWNPFIEGRPAIITSIKTTKGTKETKYFYDISVITWEGTMETRLVSQENIVLYENLSELDQEIEEFLMQYYKNYPLATD
jgi:hypothetical protein|tara:strand:+ start:223 stop:531 length:309 start_codon:yes stop_codon:yes gene_type:complete